MASRISKRDLMKRGGAAAAIAALFGVPAYVSRASLKSTFSQRRHDFVAGIDFEAYNLDETVRGIRQEGAAKTPVEQKITLWERRLRQGAPYWGSTRYNRGEGDAYPVAAVQWFIDEQANTLSFTPYIGSLLGTRMAESFVRETNPQATKKGIQDTAFIKVQSDQRTSPLERMLGISDRDIDNFGNTFKSLDGYRSRKNVLVLRIRSDPNVYSLVRGINASDPITALTERIGYKAMNMESNDVAIELEARDGTLEQHQRRMQTLRRIRDQSPEYKFKIIVALDQSLGYDNGIWDPQKSKPYWEGADAVTLNDMVSKDTELPQNIEAFKKVLGERDLYVRIYTGQKRIDSGRPGNEEDLAKMMGAAKNAGVKGTFITDTDGTWLMYGRQNPFDNGVREQWVKRVHKEIFGILPNSNRYF